MRLRITTRAVVERPRACCSNLRRTYDAALGAKRVAFGAELSATQMLQPPMSHTRSCHCVYGAESGARGFLVKGGVASYLPAREVIMPTDGA